MFQVLGEIPYSAINVVPPGDANHYYRLRSRRPAPIGSGDDLVPAGDMPVEVIGLHPTTVDMFYGSTPYRVPVDVTYGAWNEIDMTTTVPHYGAVLTDGVAYSSPDSAWIDLSVPSFVATPGVYYQWQIDVVYDPRDISGSTYTVVYAYSQNTADDPDLSGWWEFFVEEHNDGTAITQITSDFMGPAYHQYDQAILHGETHILIETEGYEIHGLRWRTATGDFPPVQPDFFERNQDVLSIRLDQNRVLTFWPFTPPYGSYASVLKLESGVLTRTSDGDFADGALQTVAPSISSPDGSFDDGSGFLNADGTTGGLVLWAYRSPSDEVYFIPITVTGTSVAAGSMLLLGSSNSWISGESFSLGGGKFAAVERIGYDYSGTFPRRDIARLRAYDSTGALISRSPQAALYDQTYVVPPPAGHEYWVDRYGQGVFDQAPDGSIVCFFHRTHYPDPTTQTMTTEHVVTRAHFTGSVWTFDPEVVLSTTVTGEPGGYVINVQCLEDGRTLVDYGLSNMLAGGGSPTDDWTRVMQMLDADFNVLQEHVFPHGSYSDEFSVLTDGTYGLAGYTYYDDAVGQSVQRYFLLQHEPVLAKDAAWGTIPIGGSAAPTPTSHQVSIFPSTGVTMTHSGGGSSTGSSVGTEPLSDEDDGTYIRFTCTTFGERDLFSLPLPATAGVFTAAEVTAIELHLRAGTADSAGGVAPIAIDISMAANGDGYAGSFGVTPSDYAEVPRDGTTTDLVVPLIPESEFGFTVAQAAQQLIDGGYIQFYPGSPGDTGWEVTIYRAEIVVTYLS